MKGRKDVLFFGSISKERGRRNKKKKKTMRFDIDFGIVKMN